MACRCQERREKLLTAVKSGSAKQMAAAVAYSTRTAAEDAGRALVRKVRRK